MSFFDKLTEAAQGVIKGAKDLSDTARQNSLIAEEQKRISDLYSKIGKLYYETMQYEADSPVGELCAAVDAANERIEKYNDEIRQIKGYKRCASCNEDIPNTSIYCSMCGVKVDSDGAPLPEDEKKGCPSCGADIIDESAFCPSCGEKL